MKRLVLFIIIILTTVSRASADGVSSSLTVYKQFKPAVILLTDGRKLSQPLANIFLKNSSLLYISGTQTKQANIKNIQAVDFDDRHYVRIDTLLAFQVDTIGNDALFQATLIDIPAYNANLRNNKQLTNLSLGEMIQTSTIDLMNEDDILLPLIDRFYFRLNGKMVFVHERQLLKILPKEKRRMFKTIISEPTFRWNDKESLLRLLKFIR